VIGKAEILPQGNNPRFIVTNTLVQNSFGLAYPPGRYPALDASAILTAFSLLAPRPGDEPHTPVGLFQALRRLSNAGNVLGRFDLGPNTLGCAARVTSNWGRGQPTSDGQVEWIYLFHISFNLVVPTYLGQGTLTSERRSRGAQK
jgi:hypothetical protein